MAEILTPGGAAQDAVGYVQGGLEAGLNVILTPLTGITGAVQNAFTGVLQAAGVSGGGDGLTDYMRSGGTGGRWQDIAAKKPGKVYGPFNMSNRSYSIYNKEGAGSLNFQLSQIQDASDVLSEMYGVPVKLTVEQYQAMARAVNYTGGSNPYPMAEQFAKAHDPKEIGLFLDKKTQEGKTGEQKAETAGGIIPKGITTTHLLIGVGVMVLLGIGAAAVILGR